MPPPSGAAELQPVMVRVILVPSDCSLMLPRRRLISWAVRNHSVADLLPLSTLKPSCTRRALAADISAGSGFNFSSSFVAQSLAPRPASSAAAVGGSLAADGVRGTVIGVHALLADAEPAGAACTCFGGDDGARVAADSVEETAAAEPWARTRRTPRTAA